MCKCKAKIEALERELAELKATVEQFRRETLEERIAQNSERFAETARSFQAREQAVHQV